jgi:hypothetical protein
MHKTNPSELGAGQAPIDQEKLARIERELRFHRERYLEVMLTMWSDSDQEIRARLEGMYTDATGNSLAELHRKRPAKMLDPEHCAFMRPDEPSLSFRPARPR